MKFQSLHKRSLWLLASILCISFSCKTSQQKQSVSTLDTFSKEDIRYLNRILQYGLDREALFTIMSDIKPMSSLTVRSFPVANIDSSKKTTSNIVTSENERYLDSIQYLQQTLDKIQLNDLKFVAVPYKSTGGNKLFIQLSVVRISSLNRVLSEKKSFFGQFGLVPGSDPYLVLSTIENADKYERFRGYGYLFGYPDYAVDFFVTAAKSTEGSKKIEARKFFQIPSFSGKIGHFVYAYPDDYTPTAQTDSTLYYRAAKTLDNYKAVRSQYIQKDSSINALKLLYSNDKQALR